MPKMRYLPVVLTNTARLTFAERQEYQKLGIMADELPTIYLNNRMEKTEYNSVLGLFLEKAERKKKEVLDEEVKQRRQVQSERPLVEPEYPFWGSSLRPVIDLNEKFNLTAAYGYTLKRVIAKHLSVRFGVPIYPIPMLLQHPHFPYLLAKPDFIAVFPNPETGELNQEVLVKCRTATSWKLDELKQAMPVEHELTARQELAVTNLEECIVAYGYSSKTDRCGWYDTKDRITGDPRQIDYRINLGMYRTVVNVWFQERFLYPYNLHAMLQQANLSYDLKWYLRGAVDVTSCLLRGKQYPYAPSLYRIGMEKVAKDILENCYSPITPDLPGPLHKKLGISKEALGWVKENNWGMEEINLLATIGEKTTKKDFLWILQNQLAAKHVAYLRKLVSFQKMENYLSKQVKKGIPNGIQYGSYSIKDGAQQWSDYLQMCENLGYDIKQDRILFPKNLRDEHDKVVQLTRVRIDPEIDRKIQKIYPTLDLNYSYTDGAYLIRPPKDFQEFIDEGVSLLHCVCTNQYYIKHVEGSNLIFFVRKNDNPDEPFCTVEYDVEKCKVLQLYGFRDRKPAKEVQDFVDGWVSLH